MILALDIGGTRTRAALVPGPARGVASAAESAARLAPVEMPARGAGQALSLDALLAFLGEHFSAAAARVDAIGVAVAGVLDSDRRAVRQALNVGWRDVPLAAALDARFGCPVVLDTDAFAAACAEARLGAGRRRPTFLYLTIGTGIGHALVLDGRVWRGVHGAASTFGHLNSRSSGGAVCYCGGRGCLCQYASGRGMARLARRRGAGRRLQDGAAVVAAAARGVRWAQQVVATATDALALTLSQALALVDCGTVIIGGGAVSAQWPDPVQLRERVQRRLHPQVKVAEIARSQVPHAALLGAALQASDLLSGLSGGGEW